MAWIDIIKNKKVHYHRISTLIILILIIIGALIQVLIPYINQFIPAKWHLIVDNSILLFSVSVFALHWYYHRTSFPKAKSNKPTIVVAIVSENETQKERLSKDFVNNLKSNLETYNLENTYDIIVLHDALSLKLRNTIDKAFGKPIDSKKLSLFNSMSSKMNAKFFVYGDFVTRNSPNNTHLLKLEGLIRHRNSPTKLRQELHSSFNDIWEREISFLEEEEINGFKSTSDQVFFASIFMLGLALFNDTNFLKSIEVNEKTLAFIDKNPNYEKYKPKVLNILASGYFLHSQLLYFMGDFDEFYLYRKKFINLIPNEYEALLSEAIYQVSRRNDPETALEMVERASKLSNGIDIWRYSKFYLLIKLNRHSEALTILDEIIGYSYKNEFSNVNQVINYNTICYNEDSNHIQSFFIIGSLAYKKVGNLPFAHEELTKFVELTVNNNNNNDWKELIEHANNYIQEIEDVIGIEA
jgi:tetratricopeptide (TPR) repeat protein